MKVIRAMLGHSRYSFTADTCASVLPEVAKAAAEAVAAVVPLRRDGHTRPEDSDIRDEAGASPRLRFSVKPLVRGGGSGI